MSGRVVVVLQPESVEVRRIVSRSLDLLVAVDDDDGANDEVREAAGELRRAFLGER